MRASRTRRGRGTGPRRQRIQCRAQARAPPRRTPSQERNIKQGGCGCHISFVGHVGWCLWTRPPPPTPVYRMSRRPPISRTTDKSHPPIKIPLGSSVTLLPVMKRVSSCCQSVIRLSLLPPRAGHPVGTLHLPGNTVLTSSSHRLRPRTIISK